MLECAAALRYGEGMTRRRSLLALPLLAGGLAVRAQAPTRERRPLQFWTMQLSPHLDAYVRGLLADFERRNPGLKVQWVDLPWSEMERKVLTAIAAGQAPDVVNLNPQFAAKLAEFNALADPGQHLSAEALAAYLPAALDGNRLEGRLFALPWYLTTNLTLFHRERLDAAPRTHAELLQMAPRLAAGGVHAYFPALDGSHPLETLVAMGAPLRAPGGCGAGFVNAQGAAVFRFYRELYQRRWVPRNVVTEGHRKAVELFVAGELAMVSTGMQFLQFMRNSNAALYERIDVGPALSLPTVAPNLALMNLAVPQASTQRDAAFQLAAFVSGAEQQLAFAKTVPVLPSTRASFADPFFSAVAQGGDLLARARALSCEAALRGAVLVPPMRAYSKLRNSFALQLQGQMLGRVSGEEALARVGREWAGLMRCAS